MCNYECTQWLKLLLTGGCHHALAQLELFATGASQLDSRLNPLLLVSAAAFFSEGLPDLFFFAESRAS
jgi:hypothetical protein